MPQLVVTKGPDRGRILTLSKNETNVIGRKDAPITIRDVHISRQHVRFFMQDHRWFIEDLGSSNGTFLNGQRIAQPTKLHDGDTITIGQTQLDLRAGKHTHKLPPPPIRKAPSVAPRTTIPAAPKPAKPARPVSAAKPTKHRSAADASSILLDALDNLETGEDDIRAYVPDFNPEDPNAWREREKRHKQVSGHKTASP